MEEKTEIKVVEPKQNELNMKIFNELRTVPKKAQKLITGGRLSGMTDIKPMWRIEKLTETFGICGIGWKTKTISKQIIDGANGEKVAIVDIELYIKVDGNWSEPIEGSGGSSFVTKEKNGLYTSDECFKMAYTDALSVCCKALGMGADVYWGDSKYDTRTEATLEEAQKYVLDFGKYNGRLLKEICEEDDRYINWLFEYEKTSDFIKQCITLLTGKVEISDAEEKEKLSLMADINTLVARKGGDFEKIREYYQVKSTADMTIDQLKDCKATLERKKDK